MIKVAVFSSTAALGLILAMGAGAVTLPDGLLGHDRGYRSPALLLLSDAVQPGYEPVEQMELRGRERSEDSPEPKSMAAGNVAMPALAGAFGVIGLLQLRRRKD